jgi:hypothetical protein
MVEILLARHFQPDGFKILFHSFGVEVRGQRLEVSKKKILELTSNL